MRKEVVKELLSQLRELIDELESELESQRDGEERLAYTISEFAVKTGLHPQTIWKYVKSGRLKASRIGSKYFIPAGELRKFI